MGNNVTPPPPPPENEEVYTDSSKSEFHILELHSPSAAAGFGGFATLALLAFVCWKCFGCFKKNLLRGAPGLPYNGMTPDQIRLEALRQARMMPRSDAESGGNQLVTASGHRY